METDKEPGLPSPFEAAAALEAAKQARAASHSPIRDWFFLSYGLMATVVMLLHSSSWSITLPVVGAYLVCVAAATLVYGRRVLASGVVPRKLNIRQTAALGLPVAALWIAVALLNQTWGWIIGAVLAGCWSAGYGLALGRRTQART